MINLLPPAFKTEMAYARRNAVIVSYVKLTVTVSIALAGALLGGRYYLNQRIAQVSSQMADQQNQIDHAKGKIDQAKSINARIASIQSIQKKQAKFSLLLDDLAQYMPKGTAISAITLTGDDKKPVLLEVVANDYNTALGFRDSITQSKRISAADIEEIRGDSSKGPTVYHVKVTFTFNPGEAR